RPNAGTIEVDGQLIGQMPPHVIAGRLKVVRTFQNIRLFPTLSVLDNVRIGRHARSKSEFLASLVKPPWVLREEAQTTAAARDFLKLVGIAHRADELAGTLSYGEQRLVEIARALAVEPRCLLLDEPAAGLNS